MTAEREPVVLVPGGLRDRVTGVLIVVYITDQ